MSRHQLQVFAARLLYKSQSNARNNPAVKVPNRNTNNR
jgi:hypothetical protein